MVSAGYAPSVAGVCTVMDAYCELNEAHTSAAPRAYLGCATGISRLHHGHISAVSQVGEARRLLETHAAHTCDEDGAPSGGKSTVQVSMMMMMVVVVVVVMMMMI